MISYDGIIAYVESLAHTSHDCPWEGDFYSRVLRRSDNKKWFGLIIKAPKSFFLRYGVKAQDGETVLNLKCPPDLQLFLREKYPEWVLPSYHMSKTHWISVVIASDMPEDEIKQLIKLSYEITESGKRAKNG